MNNPFGVNLVPAWQSPGAPGGCQDNLETADPLATLPNAGYPVNIDGFTYHPQSQVLLSWFTRQGQSYSIDGALSSPIKTMQILRRRLSGPQTNRQWDDLGKELWPGRQGRRA